jgi:hypothetical protein
MDIYHKNGNSHYYSIETPPGSPLATPPGTPPGSPPGNKNQKYNNIDLSQVYEKTHFAKKNAKHRKIPVAENIYTVVYRAYVKLFSPTKNETVQKIGPSVELKPVKTANHCME